MEKALKAKLEQVVSEAMEYFSKNSALAPKRICIYFSEDGNRNGTFEILSRVETHFLNNLDCRRKEIGVVNSYLYKQEIPAEKGDCRIDVGFLLRKDRFRKFLLDEGTKNYARGFPRFEAWANQYSGEYKKELCRFVKKLEQRNSGGNERILPPLEATNIDSVLDELSFQVTS